MLGGNIYANWKTIKYNKTAFSTINQISEFLLNYDCNKNNVNVSQQIGCIKYQIYKRCEKYHKDISKSHFDRLKQCYRENLFNNLNELLSNASKVIKYDEVTDAVSNNSNSNISKSKDSLFSFPKITQQPVNKMISYLLSSSNLNTELVKNPFLFLGTARPVGNDNDQLELIDIINKQLDWETLLDRSCLEHVPLFFINDCCSEQLLLLVFGFSRFYSLLMPLWFTVTVVVNETMDNVDEQTMHILIVSSIIVTLTLVLYIWIFWLLYYKLIPLYANLSLILTDQTIYQLKKLAGGIYVDIGSQNVVQSDIIYHVEKQLEHLQIRKRIYIVLTDTLGMDVAGVIMGYTPLSMYDEE